MRIPSFICFQFNQCFRNFLLDSEKFRWREEEGGNWGGKKKRARGVGRAKGRGKNDRWSQSNIIISWFQFYLIILPRMINLLLFTIIIIVQILINNLYKILNIICNIICILAYFSPWTKLKNRKWRYLHLMLPVKRNKLDM